MQNFASSGLLVWQLGHFTRSKPQAKTKSHMDKTDMGCPILAYLILIKSIFSP